MNIERFIRDAAAIENAYENDTLYKKVWENGSLKTMTGIGRVWAELTHFFTDDKKEILQKYQDIFTNCIQEDLGEAPGISLFPGSDSTDSDDDDWVSIHSIHETTKTNLAFYRIQPVVIAQASKAFEHFDRTDIGLSNHMGAIQKDLNTYIQNCRDAVGGINSKFNNRTVDAVIHHREIEVVYALEKKDGVKQLRRLYRKDLPRQALKAHDAFTSFWNSDPALKVAENKLPAFKALAASESPKARAAAVSLLNIVKYGNETPQIERGDQQPSLFWNVSKLWNTYVWRWFSPQQDRLNEVLNNSQQQKFDEIGPIAQQVVRDLVNERGKEMGDNLIQQYSETLYPGSVHHANPGTSDPNLELLVEEVNGLRKSSKSDLVYIPYTFKGAYSFYPSHIVVITLDKTNGQVQYYDPQALPPDHPDRLNNNLNMLDALKRIREEWQEEEPDRLIEIVDNPIIHQEDIHSCGVYIGDYINRRQRGESFEFVCLHGKNAQEIIEERDNIARQIVDAPQANEEVPEQKSVSLKKGSEDDF